MGRQENVEIFEDTLALCKQNSTLRNAIEQSTKKQKLYPEGIECAEKQAITYARPAQIIVSSKRTLEAAMPYAYAGKKVCIHNFASAANPGGGVVKGSSAQEEAICRCSTLYPNLKEESLWKQFYAPHRRNRTRCTMMTASTHRALLRSSPILRIPSCCWKTSGILSMC